MTPDGVGPLSRPFPLYRITSEGVDATVEAGDVERGVLAADLGLVSIHRLEGRFRLTGSGDRFRLTGRVTAHIEQTCVVSLDSFEARIDEDVEMEFEAPNPRRQRVTTEVDVDLHSDPPEELAGDEIDLGAITAEFLAMGVDPYPRKPGIAFEAQGEPSTGDSPFARLAQLRGGKDDT